MRKESGFTDFKPRLIALYITTISTIRKEIYLIGEKHWVNDLLNE